MEKPSFHESAKRLESFAEGLHDVVRGSLANAKAAMQGDAPFLKVSLVAQAELELHSIKKSIDALIHFYNQVYESLELEKPYPTAKEQSE